MNDFSDVVSIEENKKEEPAKENKFIKVFADAMTAALGIMMAVLIVGTAVTPAWFAWKYDNVMYLLFYPAALILVFLIGASRSK